MPPGVPKALALLVRPSPGLQPPSPRMATDLYLHFLHPCELPEQPPEAGETILHADLLKVLLGHLGKKVYSISFSSVTFFCFFLGAGSPLEGRKWVTSLDLVPFSEDRGRLSQP